MLAPGGKPSVMGTTMNNDFIALAASAIAVVSLSLSLHLWSESKACSTSLKEHLQTIETMERTLLMTK